MAIDNAPMHSSDSSHEVSQNFDSTRMRKSNQIVDTILFEIRRNMKKLIMLGILASTIFSVIAIVFAVMISDGLNLPDDPLDFLVSGISAGPVGISFFSGMNFSFFSVIAYISAAVLGGPSIAYDWEKKTGHMLFPKVDRVKLLAGRLLGLYILCAIVASLYYALVAIYTAIMYGSVPPEIWASFGIAQLFMFTILSLVIFISSWMPNSTGAIIFTIIFFLEGLMILTEVFSMFSTAEPLWSPSYLANLIIYVMKMPDPRVFSITMRDLTLTTWLTPTLPFGITILGIYIAISLCLAYFIFRRRQI
jgi:ABC-type transport system involved in multi-copper enzyme maturation permease subunit